MDKTEIAELVASLYTDNESRRKKAAFRLQSVIGDPSFADRFIAADGLPALQQLLLHASGNTLAYGLASMYNLLDVDHGWEYITKPVVERLVQLVVAQPIVNVLRGTMSILASVTLHPLHQKEPERGDGADMDNIIVGSKELKPILEAHPTFMEMLVARLTSADHALCATALQLINALLRDALNNDVEWPRFVKKLQELSVIKAVYDHMQSTGSLQELGHPLVEFQSLTRMLLNKWRLIQVDFSLREHRRALKTVYNASWPDGHIEDDTFKDGQKVEPERWQRIGFASESPAWDFEEVGYLGMMDLIDFVAKSEMGFQKLLLEQANKPAERRCPFARASLAVTSILYDHFEVDRSEGDDLNRHNTGDGRPGSDRAYKPLLLQWSRLHTSGLNAFFRIWGEAEAESEDFNKIEELLRILIEHVIGLTPRTKDVADVEQDIQKYDLKRLRELQMELLELTHEDSWGQHLRQIKDELQHEAVQFIKEQRIRCLLQGAWFPNAPAGGARDSRGGGQHAADSDGAARVPWRYVRLSPNRRWLHYSEFASKTGKKAAAPALEVLTNKIDLSTVTSVVSNVAPAEEEPDAAKQAGAFSSDDDDDDELDAAAGASSSQKHKQHDHKHHTSSGNSLRASRKAQRTQRDPADRTSTTITIHGILPTNTPALPWSYANGVGPGSGAGRGPGFSSHRRMASSMSNSNRSPIKGSGLGGLGSASAEQRAAAEAESGLIPVHTPSTPVGAGGTSSAFHHHSQPHQQRTGNSNHNNNNNHHNHNHNHNHSVDAADADAKEGPLLTLHTGSHSHAAEWIDGLLMLMNQAPITAETSNLVRFIGWYGLRIRLLNVRFEEEEEDDEEGAERRIDGDGNALRLSEADDDDDDDDGAGAGVGSIVSGSASAHRDKAAGKKPASASVAAARSGQPGAANTSTAYGPKRSIKLPDRAGLDEDYFYQIPV